MVNKRGRKRKEDPYFGPPEEAAVAQYLSSTDDKERNATYNLWLRATLEKLVESIIRKYKLYRKGITFEEQVMDTLSFLMTKADKFDINEGKKAYSYYGTICKRYNIGLLQKDKKHMEKVASYEDMTNEIEGRKDLTYTIDNDDFSTPDFIKRLLDGIKVELNSDGTGKKKLNENEKKVGLALLDILDNWEAAFDTMEGGTKYNKNSVLEIMRNYTDLSTKDIRLAMKRYKELYAILKNYGL